MSKSAQDTTYLPHQKEQQSVMLIGLMGSGKTALGRLLAEAMGRQFVDTDKMIEDESGLRISDIFELYGEAKFRELERRIVTGLTQQTDLVISVGGGAFCQADIRQAAKGNVLTIWLNARPQTLLSRMDNLSSRPLLAGNNPLSVLETLHQKRKTDYEQADVIIDTDGLSLRQSLDKLLSTFRKE